MVFLTPRLYSDRRAAFAVPDLGGYMKRVFKRAVTAVCATTVCVGLAAAQPASAAPLPIDNWTANVSTHIGSSINTDVTVPAGTFDGEVELTDGHLTGDLNLPAATFTYNAFFLLPTEITFRVDDTAPVTGHVDLVAETVEATATFDIVLTSVKLLGLEILDPVATCKTVTPTTASLTGTVDLAAAPATVELSGNYAIPELANCGWLGALVSGLTVGPTNSLDVTITAP